MLTKFQDVSEAKKAFLAPTYCPNGTKKGMKNILFATMGKREPDMSMAEVERHLAGGPKTDVPETYHAMLAA